MRKPGPRRRSKGHPDHPVRLSGAGMWRPAAKVRARYGVGMSGLGAVDRGTVAGEVSYWFAARDEAAAESMADAQAAFGFGEVAACPTRRRHFLEGGMGWKLAALTATAIRPATLACNRSWRSSGAPGPSGPPSLAPPPPRLRIPGRRSRRCFTVIWS